MSVNYNPSVVTSGLLLNLDAGNVKSYPGSGATWTDLSQNGNNGTLVNGPTFNSANGGSLVFDGVNDYVSLANSSSISFSTALTLSIWYYSGLPSNQVYNFLYLKGRTDSDTYNPFLYGDGKYMWTGSSGRAIYTPPSGYIADNTWNNLVISHSGGTTPNIYKNTFLSSGYTFTEGNGSYPLGTNSWRVGIGADVERNLMGTFNGKIGAIQLYNRALSAAEIAQNYNALRGRYGL